MRPPPASPPEDCDRFHAPANDIGLAFAQAITPEQLPTVDAAITALSDPAPAARSARASDRPTRPSWAVRPPPP